MNLVLGEAIETVVSTEQDKDSGKETKKYVRRQLPKVFVRGQLVVLVSPMQPN